MCFPAVMLGVSTHSGKGSESSVSLLLKVKRSIEVGGC